MNLVGARNSTTDKNYNIGAYGTSEVWRWGWKGNSNSVPDVAIDTNKHTFYINHANQTISIDGVVAETRVISGNITTPTTPILFGVHATSATLLYLTPVRIYEFKKWRNGELVQHLIPCRRLSDNELGMYDLVTGDFLTNAGDGDFVAGADIINPAPDNRMPIWSNNGELKFGKKLTLDATRIYAYIRTSGAWESAQDSYSIAVPVEVGKKYAIRTTAETTYDSSSNTILRFGFTNSATPTGQQLKNWVYSTPQESNYREVTATDVYLVIQCGAAVFPSLLADGVFTVSEQTIYADGTTETITDSLSNSATAKMLLNVKGTFLSCINASKSRDNVVSRCCPSITSKR